MALLEKNIVDLYKRRSNRYESALLRLDDVLCFTKEYNLKKEEKMVKRILNHIKTRSKTVTCCNMGDNAYSKYFVIPEHRVRKYVKTIGYILFDVYSAIVLKEICDFKKKTYKYVLESMSAHVDSCEDMVKEASKSYVEKLSEIELQNKNNEMDTHIFDIEQDLLSCLLYNEKIEKEMRYA